MNEQSQRPAEEGSAVAFWASSRCLGGSRKPIEDLIVERGSCVLIGPASVGKTSLLASLGRACEQSLYSGLRAHFLAGSALADLIGQSERARTLGGAWPAAAEAPTTYTFQFGVEKLDTGHASPDGTAGCDSDLLEISILDTPGQSLFSGFAENSAVLREAPYYEVLQAARRASCLVLCIDATGSASHPWRHALHQLTSHLAVDGGRRLRRVGFHREGETELPWNRNPELQLPFDRVLVLLTKADLLVTHSTSQIEGASRDWLEVPSADAPLLKQFEGLSPWALTRLMDPVRMAEHRLGGLNSLLSSLKPGAKLAVGVTSAWGLNPEENNGTGSSQMAKILGHHVPFGVFEAIVFMATGHAISPLELVSRPLYDSHEVGWQELSFEGGDIVTTRTGKADGEPTGRSGGEQEALGYSSASGEQPAPTIFVKLPSTGRGTVASFLARRLGLDVYGSRLLTRRASLDLKFTGRVLLGVFLFELAAWSFLFNSIFNGDILYRGPRTIPAIFLALLFAGGVLWFERQVLTADVRRMKSPLRAQLTRIFFILITAFVVAQPVELLMFRLPIQKRVHAEGIRQHAVTKLKNLEELESREAKAREDSPEEELKASRQRLETAIQQRNQAVAAFEGMRQQARHASSEVEPRRRNMEAARSRLRQAEERGSAELIREARETLANAEGRYQQAVEASRSLSGEQTRLQAEAQAARSRVEELEEQVAELDAQMSTFLEDRGLLLKAAGRSRNRLRAWIEQLQESKPGPVEEDWDGLDDATAEERRFWPDSWSRHFVFEEPAYDFFQELGVLYDLALGRPPVWPEGSEEAQQTLQTDFGLGDLAGREGTFVYLLALVAVHLIAVFIPFLVFTIKWFLMPKELEEYYSAWHQAFSGNPDAVRSLNVDHHVTRIRQKGKNLSAASVSMEER